MKKPRAMWVSPSLSSRGGIASYVRNIRDTNFWRDWNVHHIATHRDGGFVTRINAFALGFGQFIWELVTQRAQIAHINMASGGSFVRKALMMLPAKAFRVPVVLHIHGAEFHLFAARARKPVRILIRTALEHADVVIALGSSWADELRRIAPRAHIEVVPNAVRLHHPVQQAVAGPVHVVFLGEVGKRKGAFVLLEAWSNLMTNPDCRPARLTVAGNGEVARARELVHELGIEASVDVVGWLSEAAAATLLDGAQVLVLPSLNEGQPMAVLEAMSRGMCVVASKAGGIPEMLGVGGGILVDPEDVGGLARTLFRVVNDSDERVRYGNVAFQRIEDEFNVETAVDRIDKLYRRVLE